MHPNLVALLYLAAGVLFIMALRGLVEPGELAPRRNMLRHGRHGDCRADHARPTRRHLAAHLGADRRRPRHRRRHRRRHRAAHPHDVDAGAGGGLPLARRPWPPCSWRPARSTRRRPSASARPRNIAAASLLEMSLGVAIGAVTFTGSVIAFAKLSGRMSGKPIILPARHLINAGLAVLLVLLICLVLPVGWRSRCCSGPSPLTALLFGILIIVPIGGADMPVVISMLNSYSGWAAAGIGFTLGNIALIVTGALVGSSGAILSYIMCKGMNRSFVAVILGGFGGETAGPAAGAEQQPVKTRLRRGRGVPA